MRLPRSEYSELVTKDPLLADNDKDLRVPVLREGVPLKTGRCGNLLFQHSLYKKWLKKYNSPI